MASIVDEIRFGVVLPTFDAFRSGRFPLLPAARLAERLAFDSAWVGDHLSFHVPLLEAGCALSPAAGATERLRLGFGVMQLALRHPVWAAKQIGTLAAIAPGRLLLGVGAGGEYEPEFRAAGVPVALRGKRLDESLHIVTRLLAGERLEHPGPLVPVTSPVLEPVPGYPIPVVVGGRSDAALDRAARCGEAWLGIWVNGSRLTRSREQLVERAGRFGRRAPRVLLSVFVHVTSEPTAGRDEAARFFEEQYRLPFANVERWCLVGDEDEVASGLVQLHHDGADGLICSPAAIDPLVQYERLATVRQRMVT